MAAVQFLLTRRIQLNILNRMDDLHKEDAVSPIHDAPVRSRTHAVYEVE